MAELLLPCAQRAVDMTTATRAKRNMANYGSPHRLKAAPRPKLAIVDPYAEPMQPQPSPMPARVPRWCRYGRWADDGSELRMISGYSVRPGAPIETGSPTSADPNDFRRWLEQQIERAGLQ